MSTWHLTPQTLTAYRDDDVDPVLAASVEAHLLALRGLPRRPGAGGTDRRRRVTPTAAGRR